ncbi:MAG: response regulator [Nocardioidaceae bacterium]|nr:MAG: response regulator [Nocardioidaceae bacterium]
MSTISLSTQRGMDSQGVHDGDWVGFEVVVIDDHAVFAEALATALRTQPDFADVRVARDTATARQLLAERAPDLVLVDLRLGEQDGLSFLGEILISRPPREQSC